MILTAYKTSSELMSLRKKDNAFITIFVYVVISQSNMTMIVARRNNTQNTLMHFLALPLKEWQLIA